MTLHFARETFADGRERACAALATLPLLRPGTSESNLFAAMHGVICARGGDDEVT